MESGAVDLGNLLPTGLENPFLPGLLPHELLSGTSLEGSGSSSEPLAALISKQLEEYQLEQERRRQAREREEEDYKNQFNPFSPLSLGASYGGRSLVNNASVPETNSDEPSSPVTVEAQNQGTEEGDSLTGTPPDEPVVNPLPEHNTASSKDSSVPGSETVAQPQTLEDEPIEVLSSVPYPTEAIEAALERADNPPPVAPQKVIPPIFQGSSPPVNQFKKEDDVLIQGAELIFENNLFEIIGESGQQDFTFYWESEDSILGRIQATVATNDGSGMEQSFIEGDESRPPRLVFTGSADGEDGMSGTADDVSFFGNVLFGTYNRATIDVVKGSQRVRYLLEGGEPNPAKGCKECKEGQTGQLGGSIAELPPNKNNESTDLRQFQ